MEMHGGKDRPVLYIIGAVLLLLGLYGSFKTAVNLAVFEKYPQQGVFAIPFIYLNDGNGSYYGHEEECQRLINEATAPYYGSDGFIRAATAEEVVLEEQYKQQDIIAAENCMNGIQEGRTWTMVDDISKSFIFLILGIGVLASLGALRRIRIVLK